MYIKYMYSVLTKKERPQIFHSLLKFPEAAISCDYITFGIELMTALYEQCIIFYCWKRKTIIFMDKRSGVV